MMHQPVPDKQERVEDKGCPIYSGKELICWAWKDNTALTFCLLYVEPMSKYYN